MVILSRQNAILIFELQLNFNGSNTDGSFTTAVSNSFLSPLEKIRKLQLWDNLGWFSISY